MQKIDKQEGFTLIEILLVMALIAALAVIVLIAINPAQKFKQSRDTQRFTDVNNIAGAVQQFYVDNQGTLPNGVDTTKKAISAAGLDLCSILVPKYLVAMPVQPKGTPVKTGTACEEYVSGYSIQKETGSDRVIVSADSPEATAKIEVIR